jgi:hypothetical protein
MSDRVVLTPALQTAYFEKLLDECVRPHGDAIAGLVHDGAFIAVVLYRATPATRSAALRMGWDGESPVFALSDAARDAMAQGSETAGDLVTAAWLRSARPGRILVLAHDRASWLINVSPEDGFSLEPGTA